LSTNARTILKTYRRLLMKKFTIITLLAILAMLFAAVGPAAAQLGQTDFSSFTVQNVDTVEATVTVYFYNDAGDEFVPDPLNGAQTNPFTLDPGESFEIYVPGIPAAELPNGRYSVMIESSARVVTIANLIGSGSVNFNGSYSGFSESAPTFYLPGVVFNYYGWYSLISVQNVGSGMADIDLTITCEDGTIGTLSATDVEQFASHHFVLKETTPVGFTAATKCNGSAMIASLNNIVVTDNQSVPTAGNTQSYSGVAAGDPTVFVPALYHAYYGWDASVNVQKLGAGNTTITATYSDGGTSTCDLTDAAPACLLYMPAEHPGMGYFGATITNSADLDLMVIANAANGSQAQTYNGVGGGSMSVGVPSVMKSYYGWNTSFTCQNIGATTTDLHIEYDGFASDAYDTADLTPGDTVEVYTPGETFLPAGHVGGATVTANVASSLITCIVNFNNPTQMGSTVGDWSMSYNAFNK
jgi:hypothetical protein